MTLSLALLLLLLPLFLAVALAVKVSSPGPVLFRHRRVGLGGRTFAVLGCARSSADRRRGWPPASTSCHSSSTWVTGLWQVSGRSVIRFPQRAKMDADCGRCSPALDLRIIVGAPTAVLSPLGVK